MNLPFRKVIDFALAKPYETNSAFDEFFGDPPQKKAEPAWQGLFLEWLIFDYKQRDRVSFLDEYVLKNPDQLDAPTIDQFQQVAQTQRYSLFEIQEIKRGEWMTLEDLQTGKKHKVHEKKGTSMLSIVGTIAGRIAKVSNRWYLVGSDPTYMPLTYTRRMRRYMKKEKGGNYSPKNTLNLLTQQVSVPKAEQNITQEHLEIKRQQLQEAYVDCSERYDLTLSFEDFIKSIYQEKSLNPLDFWTGLTKKGLTKDFIAQETKILQDMWNYFPHKILGGLSPAEKRMQPNKRKRSRAKKK